MTQYTQASGLQVANQLYQFMNEDVLPGLDLSADDYWQGVAEIVSDLSPKNMALLAERKRLQDELDTWHKANPGPIQDLRSYRGFLEKVGYLVPEPETAAATVTTANVDTEIAVQAGPQLVVPILNARYALNAANARWGSLYDALYGTDVIPEAGGLDKGPGYNEKRGAKVIAWARQELDRDAPLQAGSHVDATGYSIKGGKLQVVLKDGSTTGLADASQLVGYQGEAASPSSVLLVHNGLHLDIRIAPDSAIGRTDLAGVSDVVVEAAVTDSSEPAITFFELPGADGLSTTDAEYAHKHGESGLEVQEITVRTCRLDDLLSRHLSPGDDIHFMVVDVEGGEASVLASNDWTTWRPWVLVVEAVAPMTATDLEEHTDPVVTHDAWEPALLEAGYRFCMFDGLSRFYVAEEHADELAAKLSYPAGVLDQRTHISHAEKAALQHAASAARQEAEQLRRERAALEAERDELRSQVIYWRGDVLRFWSNLAAKTPVVDFVSEDGTASAELEAMRNTLSWKVTRPLRTVRGGPVHRIARHLPPNVKSAARQLLGKG